MSLVKDPSGSFYLESDQFNVDYEENSIKFVGESGEGATYTAGEGITISGNTISVDQEKIPIIATMSVAGIVKQAEAVNDATDDAIKTINELLANLRKAGILYETR